MERISATRRCRRLFSRIEPDGEKAKKEAVIRELKGDAADSTEPEDLVALEKEVDNEIAEMQGSLGNGRGLSRGM